MLIIVVGEIRIRFVNCRRHKDDEMKQLRLFLLITMIAVVFSGCAISLPFNNRLSYPAVRDAKNFVATTKGPISVK